MTRVNLRGHPLQNNRLMTITQHTTTLFFLLIALLLILKTFANIVWAARKQRRKPADKHLYTVELLRPMVFIKLFATALTIPFFSHYILQITLAAGYPASVAFVVYALYQMVFLFALIPGGYVSETRNPKSILLIATSIEAMLFICLALTHNFWALLIVQLVFGCIQPFSASAEYAYIFHFSAQKNRNFAISLYLNTIRGAMIAGIMIGGLLATHMRIAYIFGISGILVCICIVYIASLFPKITPTDKELRDITFKQLDIKSILRACPDIFKNLRFLKTLLFIALPLGLLQEGVITFSIPIALSRLHIPHVIIGQLLVAFSIGFFMTNKTIAKKADFLALEHRFLFFGLIGIASGLFLLSYLTLSTLSISLIGLLLTGMFAGFLMTPAIAYVSKSAISKKMGENVSVSIYRTSETIGRIIGPILIGQLFIWQNYALKTYIFISILFLCCALLYIMPFHRQH